MDDEPNRYILEMVGNHNFHALPGNSAFVTFFGMVSLRDSNSKVYIVTLNDQLKSPGQENIRKETPDPLGFVEAWKFLLTKHQDPIIFNRGH